MRKKMAKARAKVSAAAKTPSLNIRNTTNPNLASQPLRRFSRPTIAILPLRGVQLVPRTPREQQFAGKRQTQALQLPNPLRSRRKASPSWHTGSQRRPLRWQCLITRRTRPQEHSSVQNRLLRSLKNSRRRLRNQQHPLWLIFPPHELRLQTARYSLKRAKIHPGYMLHRRRRQRCLWWKLPQPWPVLLLRHKQTRKERLCSESTIKPIRVSIV